MRAAAGFRRGPSICATAAEILVDWVWIDGLPGYVSYERDGAVQTTALEIEAGRIVSIFITRNPDKLARAMRMTGSKAAMH